MNRWVRNIESSPYSFRLPTSDGYFYPDFVAELTNGRILVVEYKGEALATNEDSKEKALIGELWEKQFPWPGTLSDGAPYRSGRTQCRSSDFR